MSILAWVLVGVALILGIAIGMSKITRSVVYTFQCLRDSEYSDYHDEDE